MTNTALALSVEIMVRIQRMLNLEIQKHGELSINNKTIWQGFLHQMDNNSWSACIEALELLMLQHPLYFQSYHEKNIETAQAAIIKYGDYYDNVLDMRNRHLNHKRIAWGCLMSIREILNAVEGIRLPNSDSSKVKGSL